MTFDRLWVLGLACLPVAWMLVEWRRRTQRSRLVLKALSLLAIVLALAEPRVRWSETKTALAVLVDTSASISPADLKHASQLAAAMDRERGRNWMHVVPFARSTRVAGNSEAQSPWNILPTAGEAARGTDLEAAIREAVAMLPAEMVPRVALISDGKETKGSIARAAWQAHELGIPIDTFALSGRTRSGLRLESVSIPPVAFTGEQFPIDIVVASPDAGPADIELDAEGRTLATTRVALSSGSNALRLHTSIGTPGALDLSVAIRRASAGEVRFEQAVSLRRPSVLYVTQDSPAENSHLTAVLSAAQFDVERVADFDSSDLSHYQLVILDNWDLEHVPAARKEQIEKYVKLGGGLLVVGGERNVYVEKKIEDALERSLPAKIAPPETTAAVLIMDKSKSMDGPKIELARLAASGVVENLRPTDLIGVLIFDYTFDWTVPLRRAEDRTAIKRLIAGISPSGGTSIAPALAEAYKRILATSAPYKHIVLLTDGRSVCRSASDDECELLDTMETVHKAQIQRITISTVGLGKDVNRSYLEMIAKQTGGNSYFLDNPAGLEQIVLHDVQEHSAVEKPLSPAIARQAEILDGVQMETAPALKGYVRFNAKPTAETILKLDRTDPLLARWQYGLGRSAVFASDAKSRWAADWLAWKGYDKFWINVCRDLLPRAQPSEATAAFDSATGDLVIDYRLGRDIVEPAVIPSIFVFGPDGFQRPIPVAKIAASSFRGRLPIDGREGLFRVRPLEESRVFPEVGFYRPESELTEAGSNELLLRQVAEFTGGRFEPSAQTIFDPGRRFVASTLELWPLLLALAILLSLAELVLRKWTPAISGAR